MKTLLMRLESPLMSFGAPIIDKFGVIQEFPALSLLTGLLGNALGYDHLDVEKLELLQSRIRYGCRRDRRGQQLRDYQTVDLGSDYMDDDLAWTTAGILEKRAGGTASSGTHIRLRDFLVDASYTVALQLDRADERPDIDDLASSLREPERPLFIGRKTCLPSRALFLGVVEASNLVDALKAATLAADHDAAPFAAWVSVDRFDEIPKSHTRAVTDRRDWRNQIHVGQRWMARIDMEVDVEVSDV